MTVLALSSSAAFFSEEPSSVDDDALLLPVESFPASSLSVAVEDDAPLSEKALSCPAFSPPADPVAAWELSMFPCRLPEFSEDADWEVTALSSDEALPAASCTPDASAATAAAFTLGKDTFLVITPSVSMTLVILFSSEAFSADVLSTESFSADELSADVVPALLLSEEDFSSPAASAVVFSAAESSVV